MKRFYGHAAFADGRLCLDAKPVRTPKGVPLATDCAPLAEAIAQEWNAQGPRLDRHSMPLTQLLTTALDLSESERREMEKRMRPWIDTDLLCYRIHTPPDLARRQETRRDPILQAFEHRTGLNLTTTTTLQALTQPPEVHAAIDSRMAAMDAVAFTCFQATVAASGSIVLALALTEGWIDARAVQDAVEMEEAYHGDLAREDLHGPDPHREQASRALRVDLDAIERMCGFLRIPGAKDTQ